jgi:hypothetical protein
MSFIIYCHTLIKDGRRYVGQTKTTLEQRWAWHVRDSRLRAPGCRALNDAIREHGSDAFSHDILAIVSTRTEAVQLEAEWIDRLDSLVPKGFNLRSGDVVRDLHEDTRRRMSESHKRNGPAGVEAMLRANAALTPKERSERHRLAATPAVRERLSSIARATLATLTPEDKSARIAPMLAASTSLPPDRKRARQRASIAVRTPEQHREAIRKMNERLGASGRSERSRRAQAARDPEEHHQQGVASAAARPTEFWAAHGRASWEGLSAADRSLRAKRSAAAMTTEQRSAKALKAWETRREKAPNRR